MDWTKYLQLGETIAWEGRPAPRCYIYRNWRHSLFGVLLSLLAAYWQSVGIQMAAAYHLSVLAWIPLPILLVGVYLAVGHLVLARWEWETVFYTMTNRRLLVQRGLFRKRLNSLNRQDIVYFQLRPVGKDLGILRIWAKDRNVMLTLWCIEQPRQLIELLETAMAESGNLIRPPESRLDLV